MRRWCEDATGGLKWSQDQFWRATPADFLMAVAGHNRFNRAGPEPMTRDELAELDLIYGEPSKSIKVKKNGQ